MKARGLVLALLAWGAAAGCEDCAGCTGRHRLRPDAQARQQTARPPLDDDVVSTPMSRARAYEASAPERRELAVRRAALLEDAERLESLGDAEGALSALEDALRTTGTEVALHREAARLALQLRREADARRHLSEALALAIQPRERAAVLYEIARQHRAAGERDDAIDAMERALALRPNGALAHELGTLRGESDRSALESERAPEPAHESLAALCETLGCVEGDARPVEAPEGWPALWLVDGGDVLRTTWLVTGGDEWRGVAPVAARDPRDRYGAREAEERVVNTRFEEGRLVVEVAGSFDETADEAALYLTCAGAHPETARALACFEAESAELPPPESWAHTLVFERSAGTLRLAERRAGSATQAPVRGTRERPSR